MATSSPVDGLSALLKRARLRAGLTQEQVGSALGLNGPWRRTVFRRLECGKLVNQEDDRGWRLATGVYFVRLDADDRTKVRKLVLQR